MRFAYLGILLAIPVAAQEKLVNVELAYRAPGNGPSPNFSPYGTQVKLTDLQADAPLPEGAVRPARTGVLRVGPNQRSWINILATADAAHPQDLCRLYIDFNRNLVFGDDGPARTANPTQNSKTKAWWSSFNDAEISISYEDGVVEPYMVNFWAVRETDEAPSMIRYSVRSWRTGKVIVNGTEALVAMMDAGNDAIFSGNDKWSVLSATEKDAAKRVLSLDEARPANRLMFLNTEDGKELVLEFRAVSADGRRLTFAIVDKPIHKAEDRAPDDTLAAERARPRAAKPFPWVDGDFDRAFAEAQASGRKLILDFWTSWCGPCKSMDEWIWTDAEVAAQLNAGYVGVKLDGDLKTDLVSRFKVQGYPSVIILDSSGNEIRRFNYIPSKLLVAALGNQ